jgi:hypothetical protein
VADVLRICSNVECVLNWILGIDLQMDERDRILGSSIWLQWPGRFSPVADVVDLPSLD